MLLYDENVDWYYRPQVTIVSGNTNVGKSFFCFNHPFLRTMPHLIIDFEDRWKNLVDVYPSDVPLNIKTTIMVDENMVIDYNKVLTFIQSIPSQLKSIKPKIVIIDSIGYIRRLAIEAFKQRTKRKPSNVGDYAEISEDVMDCFQPLWNYAHATQTQLIATCMLRDDYDEKSADQRGFKKKTGNKVLDLPNLLDYWVDAIFDLTRKKTTTNYQYLLNTVKSPWGAYAPVDITRYEVMHQ